MHTLNDSDLLTESFAYRVNRLTEIDARVKIVFVLASLVANLLSASIWTPAGIAVLCLAALLFIRIPPRLLLLRLSLPLVMATVVLITQLSMWGGSQLWSIDIGVFHLAAYREGLYRGLLIMWRVIAGISLILFLSMSTPAYKLLGAARWLRMPATLIELLLLIYRYIFVLLDEMIVMQEAQRVRLGYLNWRLSMNSISILGAGLILRSYDRAERVYDAMLVRGYNGADLSIRGGRLRNFDYIAILIFIAVLAGFYFLGQMPK